MANTSSSGYDDTISALSSSYFEWLETDVLPYVHGVVMVIILLTGVILNSLTIHAMRKKRINFKGGNILFVQLIILDFIAYLLILVPSIYAAFFKVSTFPEELCVINGTAVILCFTCSFVFLTIMCVERALKLLNPNVHSATLNNRCIATVLTIVTWIVTLVGNVIPVTVYHVTEYIAYQHRCNLSHSKHIITMHVTFVFGVYVPALVSLVFCLIAVSKRSELLRSLLSLDKEIKEINNIAKNKAKRKSTEPSERAQESFTMQEMLNTPLSRETSTSELRPPSGNRVSPLDGFFKRTRSEVNMRNEIIEKGSKIDKKSLNTGRVALCIYDSSSEQQDFHLCATYMLMWIIVLGHWVPFIILCYLDTYDVVYIWGGWFTFAVLLCDVSYCLKPVIFLSHNKVFRRGAVNTVPESLRQRASRARRVLQTTSKKLNNMVFIQIKDDNEDKLKQRETDCTKKNNSHDVPGR